MQYAASWLSGTTLAPLAVAGYLFPGGLQRQLPGGVEVLLPCILPEGLEQLRPVASYRTRKNAAPGKGACQETIDRKVLVLIRPGLIQPGCVQPQLAVCFRFVSMVVVVYYYFTPSAVCLRMVRESGVSRYLEPLLPILLG